MLYQSLLCPCNSLHIIYINIILYKKQTNIPNKYSEHIFEILLTRKRLFGKIQKNEQTFEDYYRITLSPIYNNILE